MNLDENITNKGLLPPLKLANLLDLTPLARLQVSSQKNDLGVQALLDDQQTTFWQSDGTLPHYIDLQFAKVVNVSCLALFTDRQTDGSYGPLRVEVSMGFGKFDLTKVDAFELTRSSGWTYLKWEASGNHVFRSEDGRLLPYIKCTFLRLTIKRNYENGKDSRLQALRVLGPKMAEARDPRRSSFVRI